MNGRPPVIQVYAALVHLYPRQFRQNYGADMIALLNQQCQEEPTARVAGRAMLDLALTIPNQHLETAMRKVPNSTVPFIYLAVSAAGLSLAIVGGTQPVTFFAGLAIALSAGSVGLIAWRRSSPPSGPEGDGTVRAQWWKFLLAGPFLIGAVIAVASAGVEAWFLGMAVVFLAAVLTTLGVILGIMHAVASHKGPQPA